MKQSLVRDFIIAFQINYKECKFGLGLDQTGTYEGFRLTIRNVNYIKVFGSGNVTLSFRLTIRNVNLEIVSLSLVIPPVLD